MVQEGGDSPDRPVVTPKNKDVPIRDANEIRAWLVAYVAKLLKRDEASVDATIPFARYSMNSATAVGMTGDLEEWLGFEMDPTLPYDYPTMETLALHLAEKSREHAGSGDSEKKV